MLRRVPTNTQGAWGPGCREQGAGSSVWGLGRRVLAGRTNGTLQADFSFPCSHVRLGALAFLCLPCAMPPTPSWSVPFRLRVPPTTAGVMGDHGTQTASGDIDNVATATTGTSAFLAARTLLRCARAASSATTEPTVLGADAKPSEHNPTCTMERHFKKFVESLALRLRGES